MNVAVPTVINKDGYIANYRDYWKFDGTNLIPDPHQEWVWNSELTKVNSKGQELETKDALNRYTAAQYGFAKNMPVALTQNARYGESFAESFEDYDYREALNLPNPSTCNSYIDLSVPNENVQVIKTLGNVPLPAGYARLNSHSGSHILYVPVNKQAAIKLNVKPLVDDYAFEYTNTEPKKQLSEFGFKIISATTDARTPYTDGINNYYYPTFLEEVINNDAHCTGKNMPGSQFPGPYNIGASLIYILRSPVYDLSTKTAKVVMNQYFEVKSPGFYLLKNTCSCSNNSGQEAGFTQPTVPILDINQKITVVITNINDNNIVLSANNQYVGTPTGYSGGEAFSNLSSYMCPGIYKLEFTTESFYTVPFTYRDQTPDPPPNDVQPFRMKIFNPSFVYRYELNCITSSYKSLNSTNTCTYTKPIPASEAMVNPTFTLVPGKHMLLSAWVKENCGNAAYTPCTKTTYDHSHIALQFNGTATNQLAFYPSGPIIEGWQKIERDFTVPVAATSAKIVLGNDGDQPVYFDDIRVHPYNANMKSYVYDQQTLRLTSELDENNYASFYEYDEEGQLIRVKKETIEGIKTIKETRSAKQKAIVDIE
ncbi:MAG: hypothetical protein HY305_07790 [Sphingobacteriales bacterium]|nr:hypothetical protein [Sphingobacteriales bacterium]